MNIDEIIAAWNAQADYMNSWQHLGEDEKLEWAMKLEREECAKLAATTVCDIHLPTGTKIYGSRVATAIRERGTSMTSYCVYCKRPVFSILTKCRSCGK